MKRLPTHCAFPFRRFLTAGLACALAIAVAARVSAAADATPAASEQVAAAATDLDAAAQALQGARDALLARLNARTVADAKAAAPRDAVLRLAEGTDQEQVDVVLASRAGTWAYAYAAVPAWRQESFHEKFHYAHRGRVGEVTRDRMRFGVDAAGLALDGDRLSGVMSATFRLDGTREERFPPGTPVRWPNTGEVWSQMELLAEMPHLKPRLQRYTIDAQVVPGTCEFELTLANGVIRAPVHLLCQVPQQPWVRPQARTPTWNGGNHDVDASGLTFASGKLSGELKIRFNPDAWYPKTPQEVTFTIEGVGRGAWISGTFKATGQMGEFEGPFEGRYGRFVRGRYTAAGDLGSGASELFGRVEEVPVDAAPALPTVDGPAASADPVARARSGSERSQALYHQVRALRLALDRPPLTLTEALVQTQLPAARWGAPDAATLTTAEAESLRAFAAGLKAVADAAQGDAAPEPVRGVPNLPDPTFGPFFGSTPLDRPAGGAAVALPADVPATGPQQWRHIPRWRIAGPFVLSDDLDNNAAMLPDLVPADGAVYPIAADRFPKERRAQVEKGSGWTPLDSPDGKAMAPWSVEPGRDTHASVAWYAEAQVVSDRDRDVWIAVSATDHGKLWINDRLVWVGDEAPWRTYNRRDAVLRVRLGKGVNRLLVRCRDDRGGTWFRFHVCVAGAPADPAALAAVPPLPDAGIIGEDGDGSRHYPDADPPLAWDIQKGINVAWRATPALPLSQGLVPAGGKLFACAHPQQLLCIDQESGKTLWVKESSELEQTDSAAFAQWTQLKTEADRKAFLAARKLKFETAQDAPLTDGKLVWVIYDTGVAAAYDLDGNRKWMVATGLTAPGMVVAEGHAVIVGAGDKSLPVLSLDATTGEKQWQVSLDGQSRAPAPVVLRVSGPGQARRLVLLPEAGWPVLDPASGRVLSRGIDADPSPGSSIYVDGDSVYFGKLARTVGMRYFLDKDGQVGCRFLWRNHYGFKYDRSVPCHAHGTWFMVCCTVQEDVKGHSPAAIRELSAYDRFSGVPGLRIKPLLNASEGQGSPVSAGPYVFVLDSGGGSAGGNPDSAQAAVVRADGEPTLVSRNLLELGTRDAPAFDGKRMFLRKGAEVVCLAVTTPEGRTYQDETLAAALFEDLWDPPQEQDLPDCEPLPEPPDRASVPIAVPRNDVGILEWMVSGPIDAATDAKLEGRLAGLRPSLSGPVAIDGASLAFKPLPQAATSANWTYGHSYYLCGMGNTVATLTGTLDLAAAGAYADRSLLLYTVLANPRSRVCNVIAPATGLDIWIGGKAVRAFDAVRLSPGYYPVLLRVRPDLLAASTKLSFSLRDRDDPEAAHRTWLRRLNAREADLKALAGGAAGARWAAKATTYLAALDEYKVTLDRADACRSVRSDGGGRFVDARPPVPWVRNENLLWTAPLPAAVVDVVATADRVAVGLASGEVAALGAADGRALWQAAVGKGGGGAVPAVSRTAIFGVTASGEAACFTMDGRKTWGVALPVEKGSDATPVVLAGEEVLVVQVGRRLYGLDPATGNRVWTSEETNDSGAPVLFGPAGRQFVATSGGRILAAADGQVCVSGLPVTSGTSPHVADGMLYRAGADGSLVAYDLPPTLATGATLPERWRVKSGGRVTAGPLAVEGAVYTVVEGMTLSVCAAADGAERYRRDLPTDGSGGPTLVSAGSRVYVVGSGSEGKTLILRAAAEYAPVWQYAVRGGSGCPFFVGDRQYIPAGSTLFAVGGREPHEPEPFDEPAVAAVAADFVPADGTPVVAFESNAMPADWLWAGPFKPRSLDADWLAPIGGREKARPAPGTTVKNGDVQCTFARLGPKTTWREPKFTAGFDALDLGAIVSNTWDSTIYFFTVLDNDEPRIVEAQTLTPGDRWNPPEKVQAALWLGSTRVEEGKLVELPVGKVPFMVQASLGRLEGGGKIWMAPRLIDRTPQVGGSIRRHKHAAEVWSAYQQEKDTLFVLAP